MVNLFHHLVLQSADKFPTGTALKWGQESIDYQTLALDIKRIAHGLLAANLSENERLGVYLPKLPASVISLFATSYAGGVFVPINPALKAPQVRHILLDCNVRILVTSKGRLEQLQTALNDCHDLHTVVLIDKESTIEHEKFRFKILCWNQLTDSDNQSLPQRIDQDMAAILYTSGSSGKPKGVVLSHRNLVTGAGSVVEYLQNDHNDRLLAVLPFSFDYGLSQLTTAFLTGASVVLMDYLLPSDVIKALAKEKITGLAGVPPLWNQLAQLDWPAAATEHLRYITNSGDKLPKATLDALKSNMPNSKIYLMYGLTEAFRSTVLPPEQIDQRPDSIGKAIPNADIMVVNEDGMPCAAGESGELVHRGSLVSQGYWNAPEKTAERFRPAPGQDKALPIPEIAVWSGDTVKMDAEGYLYFVGRKDGMIKTSGYRVSPTEIEEAIYASGLVAEVIALGIPHPTLCQAVLVLATENSNTNFDANAIIRHCRKELPNYMVPLQVEKCDALPRSANGKIDRSGLRATYLDLFS